MTECIRAEHTTQRQKRAAKNTMLGFELRRNSLVFAGAPERAQEEKLLRDVYFEVLTAAYPVYVMGIVLAMYGTDEHGEPRKARLFFFFNDAAVFRLGLKAHAL